jgi:hypothetical protein
MSRALPFGRYGTSRDDVENAPLATTTTTEAWYEERDLSDEVLPSYSEALADRTSTRGQQSTNSTRQPPREQMQISTPRRTQPWTMGEFSQKSLLNMSPCLLAPLIALFMGAIFR